MGERALDLRRPGGRSPSRRRGGGPVGARGVLAAILTVVAVEAKPVSTAGGLTAAAPVAACRRLEPRAVGESLAGLVDACAHPLAGVDGVDLWPVVASGADASGPSPREGELVAVVRVGAGWLDLRGEPVAAGYYAARVQTPPRRKEHVGIPAGWRPVVLVATASDPGTRVVERPPAQWFEGAHPRVLGLVRPGPDPPAGSDIGPGDLHEQVLPWSGGELVLRSGQLPPPDL